MRSTGSTSTIQRASASASTATRSDLRLGVLKELGRGQSFEAVALHNRFGVNQDVAFTEPFWDPTVTAVRRSAARRA